MHSGKYLGGEKRRGGVAGGSLHTASLEYSCTAANFQSVALIEAMDPRQDGYAASVRPYSGFGATPYPLGEPRPVWDYLIQSRGAIRLSDHRQA